MSTYRTIDLPILNQIYQATPPKFDRKTADGILELSSFYQNHAFSAPDIWAMPEWIDAYWSYFFPLNALRLADVIREGQRRNFFSGLTKVVDIGAGPGTFHAAALGMNLQFQKWVHTERSETPHAMHRHWTKALGVDPGDLVVESPRLGSDTLAVLSYSLNELGELPSWVFDAGGILLIEPSVMPVARKLQELRSVLVEAGFHIWAPCTHHKSCPLLAESKRDWCHMRSHIQVPKHFENLEKFLPMRNQTLTYSYLLASKTSPARNASHARVIGDTLYEKGKARQAVCRGEMREFLSWLKRAGDPQILEHGALIELPPTLTQHDRELRVPGGAKIQIAD